MFFIFVILQGCVTEKKTNEIKGDFPCVPGQNYQPVDCSDEISNSENATKAKVCGSSGMEFSYGVCTLSTCKNGYLIQDGVCVYQTCSQSSSYGTVDCKDEIYNAKTATKPKLCDQTGLGFEYGSCTLTECISGYIVENNQCQTKICDPNQTSGYGIVTCIDEIAHSATAFKDKDCNSTGSDFVYGECILIACASGHEISDDGKSCITVECVPNSTATSVDCFRLIENSEVATKSRVCNSDGDGYITGTCELDSCKSGYFVDDNDCSEWVCTPNEVFPSGACRSLDAIENASSDQQTRECNSTGSEYIYGPCEAVSCEDGYHKSESGEECNANVCTPSENFLADCTDQIEDSLVALEPRFCNSDGSDSTSMGICQLTSCATEYEKVGNLCIWINSNKFAGGEQHTCAVMNDGVKCWGDNFFGTLGVGSTTSWLHEPGSYVVGLEAGSSIKQIKSGREHSCALADTTVKCWGRNTVGETADFLTLGSINYTPHTVVLGASATSIGGGVKHTCALLVNKSVRCWGDNEYGQLGNGKSGASESSYYTVEAIPAEDSTVDSIAIGGYGDFTCLVADGHEIVCWGRNDQFQLGNAEYVDPFRTEYDWVDGFEAEDESEVTMVTTGEKHACVLVDGGIKCWGANDRGQLGDGTTETRATPAWVDGIGEGSGVLVVIAGPKHTCAIIGDAMKCWGNNDNGQLGDDSVIQRNSPVQVVNATSGVESIGTGQYNSCAIINDAGYCWGDNFSGQIGNETSGTTYYIPEAIHSW